MFHVNMRSSVDKSIHSNTPYGWRNSIEILFAKYRTFMLMNRKHFLENKITVAKKIFVGYWDTAKLNWNILEVKRITFWCRFNLPFISFTATSLVRWLRSENLLQNIKRKKVCQSYKYSTDSTFCWTFPLWNHNFK